MKRTIILGTMLFGVVALPAQAGPFDWLRSVGHSIAHPRHQTTRRMSANSNSRRSGGKTQQTPGAPPSTQPTEAGPHEPAPAPEPSVAEPAKRTPTIATPAPLLKQSSSDLPYGVPVPGKAGLVISPYSPNGGYVDIRGMPSGTEVKDPYSGKAFRVP